MVFLFLRRKLTINGAAELISDETGEKLFLVSRSRNQFLAFREMFLDLYLGSPRCHLLGKKDYLLGDCLNSKIDVVQNDVEQLAA